MAARSALRLQRRLESGLVGPRNRVVAATAAALALVVTAGASTRSLQAAPATKTIGTRGVVAEISADGARVAIHSISYASEPSCNSAAVWEPSSNRVFRLPACGKDGPDGQYAALGLGGGRLAWFDYSAGNHVYCIGPFTTILSRLKRVDLGACPEEPDNSDMGWQFAGDGDLLIARSSFRCEASCEPDFSRNYDADVRLWKVGPTIKLLLRAKDDTRLFGVDAGRFLLYEPGKLLVDDAAGRLVWSRAVDAVTAGGLDGQLVVAYTAGSLAVYSTSGAAPPARTLPRGSTLLDVDVGRAVYSEGGRLHVLQLETGGDRIVATVKSLVDADLEPSGLFYAYNVPGGGDKPGRVTFVPFSNLP